jgi:hypothetical protein
MLTRALTYLPKAFKALVAAAGGWSAAYAGAVDGGVTGDEWIVVLAAGLATGVAVWLAPKNKTADVE